MKARIKEWWRLWWDETLIIIGVSAVICLIIGVCWHLFQTTPSRLETGIVRDHRFTAQYEEDHSNPPICTPVGKSTVCIPQPDTHHVHCVGGCFELRIDGCSNDRRGVEHCRLEWITVHQTTFDNCRSGQLWTRDQAECAAQ